MARRSWVWDPKLKALVEIDLNFRPEQRAPLVFGDLPDYQSPIDGRPVSGRKQRREDLLRAGCRPWEGLDSERKEADRRIAYAEQKHEARLDHGVREIYRHMPQAHRRAVEDR